MENLRAMKTIRQSTDYKNVLLMDEYGTSVYRFCRSLTYSKEDAEDLFQETFLKVFELPEKINKADNQQSFLFSTSLFIWKSWKRKYARRNRIAPTEQLKDETESDSTVEDSYVVQEENRMVRKLVDDLPDKFKIPTILYYTLDLSVSEIAITLNVPVGTVKSRLFKARNLIEKGLVMNGYQK